MSASRRHQRTTRASTDGSGGSGTTPTVIYRIACGQSNPVSGSDGPVWSADTGYNTGSAAAVTTGIDLSGVSNPAPLSVYQNERWTNGALTYTFSGLTANTIYALRLHFAEVHYTAAGERVMNVTVNGITQVTGYDIIVKAGGMNKAYVQQLSATADSTGKFTLTLTATSASNDPKINGIEISGNVTKDDTPLNLNAQPSATYVSLTWDPPLFPTGTVTGYNVYQNGMKINSSTVTTTSFRPGQDSSALSPSTQYTFMVKPIVNGVESGKSASKSVSTVGVGSGPIETTGSFTGSMGQTIYYGVRFPSDYFISGKQYPVYYSLHGKEETYSTFLSQAINAIRPAIDAGVLAEGIIVTPDSFVTGRWEDGPLGPAETNLLELIPYIEGHYNVKSGPAWRVLTGFSMGGHGAFLHGVKHRDLFTAVWSVDGAMSYNSGDYTQYATGKSTADFHIRTIGGIDNASRVQTVINAFAAMGITIPYAYYNVIHDFALLAAADRNAGYPDIRYLQSRLGLMP